MTKNAATVVTETLRLRDGTRLVSDIYRPTAGAVMGTLLVRTPYRRARWLHGLQSPWWYAARGYMVVIQDVRGRGQSSGVFEPFVHEADDGIETVNWLAALPGAGDCVGLLGYSYSGMAALAILKAQLPSVRAVAVMMAARDVFSGWFYPHGPFKLNSYLPWILSLGEEGASRRMDLALMERIRGDQRDLEALYHFRPLVELPILNAFPEAESYKNWLKKRDDPVYWQARTAVRGPDVHVPVLGIAGWYDSFLEGMWEDWVKSRGNYCHHLLIGPWDHWGEPHKGGWRYSNLDDALIDWFGSWFTDNALPVACNRLTVWDGGISKWQSFDIEHHLLSPYRVWYLDSDGSGGDGWLDTVARPDSSVDRWLYDPSRPVPVQSYLDIDRTLEWARDDILIYRSDGLGAEHHILGTPRAVLFLESDAPSWDVVVVLNVVFPSGAARMLSMGACRIVSQSCSQQEISIRMRPISITLSPDAALVLEVMGSAYPLFDLNSGLSANPSLVGWEPMRKVVIAMMHGGDKRSRIELPFVTDG